MKCKKCEVYHKLSYPCPPKPGTVAEAFPVIDFIKDELRARGWNMWQLALKMGGDPQFNKLELELLEACPDLFIGDDGAAKIGKALGTGAQVWLNIERAYRRFKGLPLSPSPPAAT